MGDCLRHLTEKVKCFETLERWTSWLRSCCLAEAQKTRLPQNMLVNCAYTVRQGYLWSGKKHLNPERGNVFIITNPSGRLCFQLMSPVAYPLSAWLFQSFSTNYNFQFVDADRVDVEDIRRQINTAEVVRDIQPWLRDPDISLRLMDLISFSKFGDISRLDYIRQGKTKKELTSIATTETKQWRITGALLFLLRFGCNFCIHTR